MLQYLFIATKCESAPVFIIKYFGQIVQKHLFGSQHNGLIHIQHRMCLDDRVAVFPCTGKLVLNTALSIVTYFMYALL